ncbi:MAG: hypothetical protein FD161_2508 [Limisphaerales bacterium]|nr:MAG: hypothetical protein FD161_2508 [Limisphaerales bacterium]KAG0508532.1 MAG: hypothetical protein E1N63_2259 [Limisphaerales bacterium]TXT50156.1 MAG: hypothetical protein FD140_2595 [Limisphaerales bacterium]
MFFSAHKDKAALQAQVAELREQARQTEAKAADPKELERLRAQAREAVEHKKEAEEVHRLRGEVTLLRKDKAVFEQAKAENVHLREQVQVGKRLQAENNALRGQYQSAVQGLQQRTQKDSCIANLKQIDGAIQQWALEYKKVAADRYSLQDLSLLAFLRGSVLPLCPAGGTYAPGSTVSVEPTCSMLGHTL